MNTAVMLRMLVVLAFLVVMPLFALPWVGACFDAALQSSARPFAESPPRARPQAPRPEAIDRNETGDRLSLREYRPSNPASPIAPPDAARATDDQQPLTPATDRARYIQERLKELGAEYMLLERYTDDAGFSYRFHCHMSMQDSPAYAKPFQVIHSDPLQAMEYVLAEVESWQRPANSGESGTAARLRLRH